MALEIELKFSLCSEAATQLPALLAKLGYAQLPGQFMLHNAYFDAYIDTESDQQTPWFRHHDMGLRSRQKQGRFEQTLKLAGTQHGALQQRPEYNVPCSGLLPVLADFPVEVWPADVDIPLLQQQLQQLFNTDFLRQCWLLEVAAGCQLELVYDSGLIKTATAEQPIAELELELISGPVEPLFELAGQLIQHLPLRTGWLSKAARGYLLAGVNQLTPSYQVPSTLSAQVRALQHTEACYLYQSEPALLAHCQLLLQALLPSLTAECQRLAEECLQQLAVSGAAVFSAKAYNLLLLRLARQLRAA
ncbi:CYTH domain-containing protein [Arsukibacterium sp.]|uniref:CYTH domain-containing protein n=1 Tax=Arsukibacterium sp. TaxID=1977258 RepID=UPI002FD92891